MPLRLVREATGFDLHIVSFDDEERARMRLRSKLLLAQLPLALALVLVGYGSRRTISAHGPLVAGHPQGQLL